MVSNLQGCGEYRTLKAKNGLNTRFSPFLVDIR